LLNKPTLIFYTKSTDLAWWFLSIQVTIITLGRANCTILIGFIRTQGLPFKLRQSAFIFIKLPDEALLSPVVIQ